MTARRIAVVFGQEGGAIDSQQVFDAAREAYCLKFDALDLFGFAIQAKARELVADRSPASYFFRVPDSATRGRKRAIQLSLLGDTQIGQKEEIDLVNRIRGLLAPWRAAGYPDTTGATRELLQLWRAESDQRAQRLFFAQIEAVETVIFLMEGRRPSGGGCRRSPWTNRGRRRGRRASGPSPAPPARWRPALDETEEASYFKFRRWVQQLAETNGHGTN